MKIKAIIEKKWSEMAINEAMNNPRYIEEYEDISDRLELAALAWARKQNLHCCPSEREDSIAAYDIGEGIEAYFYDCMVDNYIADYVEKLAAV